MNETTVERGFRPAKGKRDAALFYRVINGPRCMKNAWRDISGKQLRNVVDVTRVDAWTDWQIALLPSYQHSIVVDDGRLIERAQTSDSGSRPNRAEQQPKCMEPAAARLITAHRRGAGAADFLRVRGRRYHHCRGGETD